MTEHLTDEERLKAQAIEISIALAEAGIEGGTPLPHGVRLLASRLEAAQAEIERLSQQAREVSVALGEVVGIGPCPIPEGVRALVARLAAESDAVAEQAKDGARQQARADRMERERDEARAVLATAQEAIETRLLAIAEGCHDYGGGHHSDGKMDAYQHGISTVVRALKVAIQHDDKDPQVAALERIGRAALASPRSGEAKPNASSNEE
jgi:hypothetical protein